MRFPFLDQGRAGNNNSTSTVGAMAFTWGGFFVVGGFPFLALLAYVAFTNPEAAEAYFENPEANDALPISNLAMFVIVMLQFPIALIGVWAGTKYLLQRSMKSLITSARKFRWGRMLAGLALWAVLMGCYAFILYLRHPGTITYAPDWERFFIFLPIALILVPIQCSFEEIAVRGQLMQITHARTRFRPLATLLFTSFLFAMLHSLNPEVQEYGWLTMMAQYFAIGLVLGLFAILDGGLELSIGMHTANNLFSFLLLSYPGSVLETPSVFQQEHIEPWQDFLAILGMGFVLFVILYGRRPHVLQGLISKRDLGEDKSI